MKMAMKKSSVFSIAAGFLILFLLYHLAEYMIVFRNSASGFLLMQGLFFIAAFIVAKWQFGKGLVVWGFVKNKNMVKQIIAGLFTGCTIYTLTFCLSLILGSEHIAQIPDTRSILRLTGLFVFGNFFSSVSEDILTRGYIFRHTLKKIKEHLVILLSATIYVLNHIYRLGDGWETYTYLFSLGILFIIPLVKTSQIWTTCSIHWAGNCTFYFTHEVIKTSPGSSIVSPNMILVAVLIFFIVLFAFYNKFLRVN